MSSVRESASQPFPLCALRLPVGQEEYLLLIRGVSEPIAGVEDAEVVDVLDISLTKIKTYMESICKEMKSVEGFGLGFGDRRDLR